MSAFLCSDTHTCTIAVWAHAHGLTDDPIACAVALRAINNEALRQRYGDAPAPLGDGFAHRLLLAGDTLGHRTPAWVNAIVSCFAYQCAEGDADETHPAAPLLRRIKEEAARLANGERAPSVWSI